MSVRILLLVVSCTALVAGASRSTPEAPSYPSFVRGVSLGLFASEADWDYGPMIEEIAARGATDLLLVVPLSQRDRFAVDVTRAPTAPSDAALLHVLEQARNARLRAAVMPIVRLRARPHGEWRGLLAPARGVDAWFEAYGRELLALADVAELGGATRLMVGSELLSLEGQATQWRTLIARTRDRFSGTLTYSANWDHFRRVSFWQSLDEIGITGYFPVEREHAANTWTTQARAMRALGDELGKPVMITEVGYPSQAEAHRHPWDDTRGGTVDTALQRELWSAFCDGLWRAGGLHGFYAWNWFGYGGPRDIGFTLRGKPAASTLASCFARDWQSSTHQRSEP